MKDGKDGITFEDRDDRLLIIDSAKKEHAGRYFCTASIGEKNDTVEGSLIFEGRQILFRSRVSSNILLHPHMS